MISRREHVIEWGQCDAAGIVFYPQYYVMFDACTSLLFERAGWPRGSMFREFDIHGLPLVETSAKYSFPLRFGDHVTIETRVAEWKRTSFVVRHDILKDGKAAVEGTEIRVWAGRHPDDPARMKAMPIPEEVVRRLSADG